MIGIYKISNKVDDRVYVGKSNNIFRRWKEHEDMLKSNKHHSSKLQKFYNENGGIKNLSFDILETTDDVLFLDKLEEKWVKELNSINVGFNVASVGSNISVDINQPKEKVSDAKEKLKEISIQIINQYDIKSDENELIKFFRQNDINNMFCGRITKDFNRKCNEFYEYLDECGYLEQGLFDFANIVIVNNNNIFEVIMNVGVLVYSKGCCFNVSATYSTIDGISMVESPDEMSIAVADALGEFVNSKSK